LTALSRQYICEPDGTLLPSADVAAIVIDLPVREATMRELGTSLEAGERWRRS
jgi:hypothetical protein